MPPKMSTQNGDGAAENGGNLGINPKEFKLLESVLKYAAAEPKPVVDWAAVASAAKYGAEKTAKDRFRKVCQKYGWFQGAITSDSADTAAATKKTPVSKKRARAADDVKPSVEDDSAILGDDELETPSKKRKTIMPKKGGSKKGKPSVKTQKEQQIDEGETEAAANAGQEDDVSMDNVA
ncbi:hypothetical protein AAE478_005966 [Parahypoxylon ruwenzoriense]